MRNKNIRLLIILLVLCAVWGVAFWVWAFATA